MELGGKHILVTGASSGIGRVIAQFISNEGGRVALLARNKERLEAVFHSLNGDSHSFTCCDLNDNEKMQDTISQIDNVDGVVFCAGINEFIPIKFIKQEKINSIFQTNYFSQISLIRTLLKKKKINKGASLVFISSISSLMGVPGTLLYSASKAAVNSTVKVLAVELSGQKIRANAICPGIVRTPMLGSTNISEEQFLEQEKQYPLGIGTPEDVAEAAVFHLSDKSKWLTGNIMILDGGFSLQ